MRNISGSRILLIISGGIAAYKSLELIRLIRRNGGAVRCILTHGGAQFVTPLSVASLSGEPCYTELWSLKDESEMGHIRLSREADLIVVAPASANMIAKMAQGMADDLASTTLLASDKPVLVAPAMNGEMWAKPATQDNIRRLEGWGIARVGPGAGDMACGETGTGRMAEPEDILDAIAARLVPTTGQRQIAHAEKFLSGPKASGALRGLKAVVTAGPTHEPLDPVRYIGNRSSGKQGYAIAAALRDLGAQVTLVSGPTALDAPADISMVRVETAAEMLEAVKAAMPADIAVCAAAVADWTPVTASPRKIKKQGRRPPDLRLKENPDILATLARPYTGRPKLVIGFAAETDDLLANATAKRAAKNCDWILANDVGPGETGGVFGADDNHVWLIDPDGAEDWGVMPKGEVAGKLAQRIASHFKGALS